MLENVGDSLPMTNQDIPFIENYYGRAKNTNPIDLNELIIFIELLFLAEVHNSNTQNLE